MGKITTEYVLSKSYSKGSYNQIIKEDQWIRISEGCPNNCPFCAETKENGKGEVYYPIPAIVRNQVKIIDMNLTYKSKFIEIINELGQIRVDSKVVYYELLCGIDYRFMDQNKSDQLKKNRFVNIRLAWDHSYLEQKRIKKTIDMLKKSGYGKGDITVFMICNWKRSFNENMLKMDLCKIWNVKIADCWFDNQLSPSIKPIHWKLEEIKTFRKKVRKHNQMVNFGIDPELDCNQYELF